MDADRESQRDSGTQPGVATKELRRGTAVNATMNPERVPFLRVVNPAGFVYSIPMRHRRSKDRLTRERRSWNMSRIRGKDTTPEMRVRSLLHRLGYRFRLHVRIPITAKYAKHAKSDGRKRTQSPQKRSPLRLDRGEGQGEVSKQSTLNSQPKTFWVRPDILLPKFKTAIFVHGCFWRRHRLIPAPPVAFESWR